MWDYYAVVRVRGRYTYFLRPLVLTTYSGCTGVLPRGVSGVTRGLIKCKGEEIIAGLYDS